MAIPPIAALEIGTTHTIAVVGEIDESQRVKITGRGIYKTTGMRKGEVIDVAQARIGVERAVKQADEESQVNIGELVLAVSGSHITAEIKRGSHLIQTRGNIVSHEDVEEVTENAKALSLPPERAIMHTMPQAFTLDEHGGIIKPEGLHGTHLALDMLTIHALRSPIENLRKVVQSAELNVQDVIFSGLCVALSTLSAEQKRAGVVIIDLGGGTTNFLAYANNVIAGAGSFGIGGDHITNDLVHAFNLTTNRAETLKRSNGEAVVSSHTGLKRLIIPEELGFEERSISLKAFHAVINARLDETLKLVHNALARADLLRHLGAGVIFTGGGAAMPGLLELGSSIFGCQCHIGTPVNVSGLEDVDNPAAWTTVAGAVLYGLKTYQETSLLRPVKEFLQGIFRR